MLLVDNFRVFVLVGLICASGIDPSQAQAGEKCKAKGGTEETCTDATKLWCLIDSSTGDYGGCAGATECGGAAPTDQTIVCETGKMCCCVGSDTVVCNDLKTAPGSDGCKLADLTNKGDCAAGPPPSMGSSSSTPSTGVGPTGDGDAGSSLTISTGVILTVMSLGKFWSHGASRIHG